MSKSIAVAGIQVRQDEEGRFNLNDLHRASGGVSHHQPGKFFANKQARELLESGGEVVSRKGYGGGSYASKEIAIAYAMWIGGPSMTMKVIQSSVDMESVVQALNEFEVPDGMDDMYVYAIKDPESGRIKLGISKDPERRVKQLQTGCSSKLELMAYRKAENRYKDEAECHRLNSDIHVRGEWFESNASLDGPMGVITLVEVAA